MSGFSGSANPIFYAQFHLRGGWKNTLITAGGYALLIGGAIWFSAASSENHSSSTLSGWTHGLLGLQVVLLLLYGAFRVSSSVRADVTGKIIESHRLMPLSPAAAVFGYLTGAPAQAIALALVNLLLGGITTALTTGDQSRWLLANAMLAAFAVMLWAITAQIAFSSRGGFALIIIFVLVALTNGGEELSGLPGLMVLTSPLLGRSIFYMQATFSDVTFAYAVAILAQFAVGVIAFIACTRRYRSPDAIGLTDFLGIVLLAAWIGISGVGIRYADEFHMPRWYGESFNFTFQFVSTLVTGMLLAVIPLSSSAKTIATWRRNGGPTPSLPRRPLPAGLTMLLATAVISLFLLVHPSLPSDRKVTSLVLDSCVLTIAIIGAFALGLGLLFRWLYAMGYKAWLIVLLWIALMWIGPLLGDVVYRSMSNDNPDSFGAIAAMSPIGALSMIWRQYPTTDLPGIAFQLVVPLIPVVLLLAVKPQRNPLRRSSC